jgi:hypothetical protein
VSCEREVSSLVGVEGALGKGKKYKKDQKEEERPEKVTDRRKGSKHP